MSEKRPYIVATKNGCGSDQRIVMAASRAQALRHVAEKTLTAKPATGAEVVKMMQGGTGIEVAGAEANEAISFDTLNAASGNTDSDSEGGEA